MGRLKDKVVLIIGGNPTIGDAIAVLFAEEDAKIMMGTSSGKEAGEVIQAIQDRGGKALWGEVDPTNPGEVKEVINKTVQAYGGIDILCHVQGVESVFPVTDVPGEEWRGVLAANLESVFLTAKYTLPVMVEQGGGVIITTSSVFGLIGWPNTAASCASQGGVVALTKQMAVDYGPHNIRINCICHGPLLTSSINRFLSGERDVEKAKEIIAQMHPLGRFVQPEEIARTALFLAGDEASFITGVVLPVDGGYTGK